MGSQRVGWDRATKPSAAEREGHRVAWPDAGALGHVCVEQKATWSGCEGQASSLMPGAASLRGVTRTQSRSQGVQFERWCSYLSKRWWWLAFEWWSWADEMRLISECTWGHGPHSNHTALTSSSEEPRPLVPPGPSLNTFPALYSTSTAAMRALLPGIFLFTLL